MIRQNFIHLLFFLLFCDSQSYKILAVYQLPAGSHYILASRLFTEIARRGHEVTFISPFAEETPVENLTTISIESLQDVRKARGRPSFALDAASPFQMAKFAMNMQYSFTEHLLQHKKIQNLLHSGEKFDAVMIYQYLNDGVLGIAHHFQAPVILFSSMPLYPPESFLLAHPTPPSYVPNILTEYTGHMNFWQRLRNTFYDASIILYYVWNVLPKHRELVRQHIPGSPDLYDFVNNASLILVNSHVSTNEAIPYVPNAVEIGGYHIQEPKPLPSDLQKFLDESTNGVILFSMGSLLRSSEFPEDKRTAILQTFGKLKENVLWKWEDDNVPGLPKNVKIMKWVPQSDVLAHPSVKAFISHGGLLSTMESVYHAVPIVGIPVFVDQKMNMALASQYEYAIEVPYRDITEENLSKALDEILNNPKYRQNIQKRSQILRDRPMKPMDTVLYWIEYVIRHQGAHHLRYPGMDLNWFQRNLLDIVAFVLITSSASLLTLVVITRKVMRKSKSADPNKKNK